jgi:hypothetical protein
VRAVFTNEREDATIMAAIRGNDCPLARRRMMAPPSDSKDFGWKGSYTAALFEEDSHKVPVLIARAESEILGRARLLWSASGDKMSEILALDNALRMLQVLKICHKGETANQNAA